MNNYSNNNNKNMNKKQQMFPLTSCIIISCVKKSLKKKRFFLVFHKNLKKKCFLPFLYLVHTYTGGENDDGCCINIRRMLVTIPYIFHTDIMLSGHNGSTLHTGSLFIHILAGDE